MNLSQIQLDFLYALQNFRELGPAWVNKILVFLSEGSMLLLPLFCAILFWCADKKKGSYVIHAFCFAFLANGILKLIFCVYRPWVLDPRLYVAAEAVEEATGYSFPSAHCTMCVSILGAAAVAWPKKKVLTVIAVAMTAVIMFARMYLGAHTPMDVLVGTALGILFILLFKPVLNRNTDNTVGDWKRMVLLLACTAGTLLIIQLKSYPLDYLDGTSLTYLSGHADYLKEGLLVDPEAMKVDTFSACGIMAGLAIGLYLERRFIHFEMPASIGKAILRGAIGGVVFALLYAVIVKKLVASLNPNLGKTIRYFVVILFTMMIYPWIIKCCKGKL